MSPTNSELLSLVGGSRDTHRWHLSRAEHGSYWMRTISRESLKAKEFVLGEDFRAGQVLTKVIRLLVAIGDERKIHCRLAGLADLGVKRYDILVPPPYLYPAEGMKFLPEV